MIQKKFNLSLSLRLIVSILTWDYFLLFRTNSSTAHITGRVKCWPVAGFTCVCSYPLSNMKRIFCCVQRYSTVGVRVPIWRLRMLLKICATSFLPWWKHKNNTSSSYSPTDFNAKQQLSPSAQKISVKSQDTTCKMWCFDNNNCGIFSF